MAGNIQRMASGQAYIMIMPLARALRAHPLKLVGIFSFGWGGIAMLLAGLFVFGKDAYTWLVLGGKLDVSFTSVFEVLSPLFCLTAPSHGLFPGLVEFSKAAPLSFVLMALGWCSYKVAELRWDVERVAEESPWRHSLAESD